MATELTVTRQDLEDAAKQEWSESCAPPTAWWSVTDYHRERICVRIGRPNSHIGEDFWIGVGSEDKARSLWLDNHEIYISELPFKGLKLEWAEACKAIVLAAAEIWRAKG